LQGEEVNRSLILSYFCLFITFVSLALAFAVTNFPWVVLIILVLCTFWGLAIWRKWRLGEILSLFLMILCISIAAMMGSSRLLVLASSLATLATWDLSAFHKKLSENENTSAKNVLFRTHLMRLSTVLILGLALPTVAFAMTFALKFWQVFLLGMILLLGLSQVFSQLKGSSN